MSVDIIHCRFCGSLGWGRSVCFLFFTFASALCGGYSCLAVISSLVFLSCPFLLLKAKSVYLRS